MSAARPNNQVSVEDPGHDCHCSAGWPGRKAVWQLLGPHRTGVEEDGRKHKRLSQSTLQQCLSSPCSCPSASWSQQLGQERWDGPEINPAGSHHLFQHLNCIFLGLKWSLFSRFLLAPEPSGSVIRSFMLHREGGCGVRQVKTYLIVSKR